jgi:hypothetical protein
MAERRRAQIERIGDIRELVTKYHDFECDYLELTMRPNLLFSVLGLYLLAEASTAQCVLLSDPVDRLRTPFFVMEGNRPVKLEPAFEDYQYMLWDTCDAIGLPVADCSYPVLMGDIGFNAAAALCPVAGEVIIYDRRLSSEVGGGGAQIIIAHELAHIRCGHLTEAASSFDQSMLQELEADRFAGAAMARMGQSRESLEFVLPLLSKQPSLSHPSREARREALETGFDAPENFLCRHIGQP